MSSYDIDVDACRGRQQRLVAEMQKLDLDLVIVTQNANVQWLCGVWFAWLFEPAAAMSVDGHLTLVAPNEAPAKAAADHITTYEAQCLFTMRNDQRQASSESLLRALAGKPKSERVGVEYSTFGPHLAQAVEAELVDIERVLYVQRRRKDPDELALIRNAIAGTASMYQTAREIIKPGICELEVFNQFQAAAVDQFGEMLTGTGNDYQCASMGGPPRGDRKAEAGELYILDLGPAFRGYFTDNCRTIAVTHPTDEQQEAWEYITKVFKFIEQTVRPGSNAKWLYHEALSLIEDAPLGTCPHHLGHGFGLYPHEAPHLNPNWDDTFLCGDVFTVEPGLYAPELRAGIRVENNYRVTEIGVELLTDFPLDL